jgi:hypothetical protein
MDALITVANLLNATGYFLKDRLLVRGLSFTAASCLSFYYIAKPGPAASVAYWSLFFAALNVLFIARLVIERRRAATRDGGDLRTEPDAQTR